MFDRVIEILREQGPIALVRRGAVRALVLFRFAPERYEAQSSFRLSAREMRTRAHLMRVTPRELTLETITDCNLRCVMCPHAFDAAHSKGTEFPESAAAKLRPYVRRSSRFQLHGTGEPMLSRTFWRRLLEIIKRENRGKPEISFNTNGTALNDTNIGKLIEAGVSHVSVSLDAARSTTYRKVGGASLDTVLANVRRLTKARDAARSQLRVAVNATLMRVNIEELPELVVLGIPDQEYDPEPRADALEDAPAPELAAYVSELADWPRSSSIGECQAPWRWLMVASDGSARPCCFAQKSVGNIVTQAVEDVWNGSVIQEVRSAVGQGRIHPICKGAACKFVMGQQAARRE